MPDHSPRKILLLARGGSLDGAQRQTLYLALQLPRLGYTPHLLLNADGPMRDHLHAANIPNTVLPMRGWRTLRGFLCRPFDLPRLRQCAASINPALIHACDIYKVRYALALARRLRCPTIAHVRGPVTPRDLTKHAVTRTDAVIAIASRYATAMQRAGLAANRLHVIDDAVDFDRFTPAARADSSFRREYNLHDTLAVGIVGRVEPFKKIREFAQLAQLTIQQNARAKFFVIGETADADYHRSVLHAIPDAHARQNLIFTGRRDDMPNVLAGLDVLVTLSGGSVMFEAQAVGTPVLSISHAGQFSDHTRHNETALCLHTTDMHAAADCLLQLLADPARRAALAACAQTHVQAQLSITAMVQKTVRVYDALLSPAR